MHWSRMEIQTGGNEGGTHNSAYKIKLKFLLIMYESHNTLDSIDLEMRSIDQDKWGIETRGNEGVHTTTTPLIRLNPITLDLRAPKFLIDHMPFTW